MQSSKDTYALGAGPSLAMWTLWGRRGEVAKDALEEEEGGGGGGVAGTPPPPMVPLCPPPPQRRAKNF